MIHLNLSVNFHRTRGGILFGFLFVLSSACDTGFSSSSDRIKAALAGYQECASTAGAREDLQNVEDFLNKLDSLPPSEWRNRFCEAQQGTQHEYHVVTRSIDELPLMIKQKDISSDGDALIPHTLVVGGHVPARFRIESVKYEYDMLQFEPWESECVPFLFELGSLGENLVIVEQKQPASDMVYFIAALCRAKSFHFKYFRYDNLDWLEIPPHEFPKERALENLWDWMGGGIRYARDTPKYIQDGLQQSDKPFGRGKAIVKPDNWNFYTGLTARMWAHLESGVDFDDFDRQLSDEEAKNHAMRYVKKYNIQVAE